VRTALTVRLAVEPERRRRRLDFAPLVEDFDPPLGRLQRRVTEPRQLHAALEELERPLERKVALFERFHDCLELGDRRLEIFDGGSLVAHVNPEPLTGPGTRDPGPGGF
jgi:hypothetical protein